MARFYASIQGNRGEATRMGTPESGITGHIRGWNIGARIDVDPDNLRLPENKDVVAVYLTGGSDGPGIGTCIATAYREDDKVKLVLKETPIAIEAARDLLERHAKREARSEGVRI